MGEIESGIFQELARLICTTLPSLSSALPARGFPSLPWRKGPRGQEGYEIMELPRLLLWGGGTCELHSEVVFIVVGKLLDNWFSFRIFGAVFVELEVWMCVTCGVIVGYHVLLLSIRGQKYYCFCEQFTSKTYHFLTNSDIFSNFVTLTHTTLL